ncbi:MAG: hypothetical protein K2I44_10965 [Muribaculaceae bacterium]|nr:hypothetical protein [Muribaculaceae bacterium]
MKKFILSIAVIAATSFASFADTTLSEAYNALSNLSGMSEKSASTLQITPNASIKNVKTSVVNTSSANAQEYRDKFIYMMENLPVRDMVIGANNQRELAAVYSTPAGGGIYNVLIVTGNTLEGNFSVSYGQTNRAGINAIRNSQVSMDSQELVVTSSPESGTNNFVSMNQ